HTHTHTHTHTSPAQHLTKASARPNHPPAPKASRPHRDDHLLFVFFFSTALTHPEQNTSIQPIYPPLLPCRSLSISLPHSLSPSLPLSVSLSLSLSVFTPPSPSLSLLSSFVFLFYSIFLCLSLSL